MSIGNWRNGLAIGLVIGSAAAIIFMLVLDAYSPSINLGSGGDSDCQGGENRCQDFQNGRPDWGYWFRRIFALEDTLAQWIMMAFTIAAAWLLFSTLKATQRMADDSRRIGEAQTRAYMFVSQIEIGQFDEDKPGRISAIVHIKNCGVTPAYDVTINSILGFAPPNFHDVELPIPESKGSPSMGIVAAGQTSGTTTYCASTDDVLSKFKGGSLAIFACGVITYTDIFKNQRTIRYQQMSGKDALENGSVFIDCAKGNYET